MYTHKQDHVILKQTEHSTTSFSQNYTSYNNLKRFVIYNNAKVLILDAHSSHTRYMFGTTWPPKKKQNNEKEWANKPIE